MVRRTRSTTIRCGLCIVVALGAGLLGPMTSAAHTRWVDGSDVPAWVRNACCSLADTHHLQPWQVHRVPNGFSVDGIRDVVPLSKVLPSQDGEFWAFYRDFDDGTQYVFCFFAPPESG